MGHSLLHRYWFKTPTRFGIGVTAYSVEDARTLIDNEVKSRGLNAEELPVIEDVDIRDLDQNHVILNMGSPNFRGIWFPCLNL